MLKRDLPRRIVRVKYLLPLPRKEYRCFPQFRAMATGMTGHLNRLAAAKSPYLRQHATNPVDWYPFEKAALEKAKAENKVNGNIAR
jgi:hypothetical protein